MAHRQFEDRGRLVIYMEQRDINALTAHAKLAGRLLIPWARETLLFAISEVPMDEPTKPKRRSSRRGAETSTAIAELSNARGSVEHTAKSNRLTCGCATCSAYRHDHGIPLGGLKKDKEKLRARN